MPTLVSEPQAADAAFDWRCPDCGSFLDRTVGGLGLNLRNLVSLDDAEHEGIPCYGLRRGAFLRGRLAQRKPSTDGRIYAAMDHGRSDYRPRSGENRRHSALTLWHTAQLARRDRWLDLLRQRVASGSLKLTAAVARMLGMPWDDGALLTSRTDGEHALDDLRSTFERTAALSGGWS